VANVILWNNSALIGPEVYVGATAEPSSLTMSYSDVKGGLAGCHVESGCTLVWGSGTIAADPLFVDSAGGDHHLTHPCHAATAETTRS
jgi:hypothetical protein